MRVSWGHSRHQLLRNTRHRRACQELELPIPINVQADFSREDSLISLTLGHSSQASGFTCHALFLKESATSFFCWAPWSDYHLLRCDPQSRTVPLVTQGKLRPCKVTADISCKNHASCAIPSAFHHHQDERGVTSNFQIFFISERIP